MPIVRRVLPHEYYKYRTHLLQLDTESKYLRFGYQVTDAAILDFCRHVERNMHKHILFCVENESLEFVAVGHISTADGMELAFSVLQSEQGKGIGSALMQRCIQWCRAHCILNGTMVCLSHNTAIKNLCKKHNIKTNTAFGETNASVELSNAQLDTYIREHAAVSLDVIDWISKRIQFLFSLGTKYSVQ